MLLKSNLLIRYTRLLEYYMMKTAKMSLAPHTSTCQLFAMTLLRWALSDLEFDRFKALIGRQTLMYRQQILRKIFNQLRNGTTVPWIVSQHFTFPK